MPIPDIEDRTAERKRSVIVIGLTPGHPKDEADALALAACGFDVLPFPCSIDISHVERTRTLAQADFVWLGCSATNAPELAFVLGLLQAFAVPVFARHALPALEGVIGLVAAPIEAVTSVESLRATPGAPLAVLQRYYAKVARERGYGAESARDCLLLLTEEVGELARAIRKASGLERHMSYDNVCLTSELADVQLYLLHLANILEVDLGQAVISKEAENARRFQERRRPPEAQARAAEPQLAVSLGERERTAGYG